MLSTPYIRKTTVISFSGILLCATLLSVSVSLAALLVIACIRYLALQRLQGVTGDVYGACVEIVETTVLISWVLTHG